MAVVAQDTTVKWLTSGMSGAPAVSAAAGSLTDMLDAVLVNGWGLQGLTQIVVASEIASVTCATSSGMFYRPLVVNIAGVTPTSLNGDKRVLSSDGAVTFTFAAPGVADGTYNPGGMTVKLAPLGWSIWRTATNKRMYKSNNVLSNGVKLRVNDTNGTYYNWLNSVGGVYSSRASVSPAVDDTTIDNGFSLGESISQWTKSNTSTGTASRPWAVCGDDRGFYICILADTNFTGGRIDYFGEIANPTRPNDAYATIITSFNPQDCAVAIQQSWNGTQIYSAPGYCNGVTGYSMMRLGRYADSYSVGTNYVDSCYITKSHSQFGGCQRFYLMGSMLGSVYLGVVNANYVTNGSGANSWLAYPNAPDAGIYIQENVYVIEDGASNQYGIRGTMPGYVQVLQTRPTTYWQNLIENMPGAPGRQFRTFMGPVPNNYTTANLAMSSTSPGNQLLLGELWVDSLGPWVR